MDPSAFDTIVRAFATVGTRRRLVRLLAALPLGGALVGLGQEAGAEKPHERLHRRTEQRYRKQRNRNQRNKNQNQNNKNNLNNNGNNKHDNDGGGGGGPCNAKKCPQGCCAGRTCAAGNSVAQCGTGGAACQACATGELCVSGTCRTVPCTHCPAVEQCIDGGCVCAGFSGSVAPQTCCTGGEAASAPPGPDNQKIFADGSCNSDLDCPGGWTTCVGTSSNACCPPGMTCDPAGFCRQAATCCPSGSSCDATGFCRQST